MENKLDCGSRGPGWPPLRYKSQRNTLQEKLKTQHTQEEACSKLQERLQKFESQLCEADLLLEKEKAKYNSACRHQESMERKQKSLLQRVDALDDECDELQKRLEQREERELNLNNQLQRMSEDNEQLRTQLTSQQDHCSQLQSERQMLETQIDHFQGSVAELKESVKSLEEKERLLVAFPELSPLAHAQPKSTGNVLLDMEKQLQANYIRIGVLEKENATLHGSLVKLRETQHNPVKKKSPVETCSFYSASPPVEQLRSLTQKQRSSIGRQAPCLGYSDRGNKVIGVECGWMPTSPEAHMPTVSGTLLSPHNISLQTLNLNINSTVAKTQTRNAHKTSYRSFKLRRK
ncbi:coiled-coil domain-containing protein 157-like [Corythoichthys intestinalis]|uniref:coiled-coil domain-containing protein 157-like n=1 Tax=Corythoichthys intestinalis TaxID=161448 RepID=UPI0025A517A2|nr:coiled-coil domain-containing protein 157-like [Corythoichthys intestinalis]